MPLHLHLDFETFSEIDISVGAYRYAFDPSTEILCAAMAFDDEEPEIWRQDFTRHQTEALEKYWLALEDPEVLIYAHNAQFEMAICQALLAKTWGIDCPNLDRFRCTMSMARRAALPPKLEMLALALDLDDKKDKKGKALIKKFSCLQAPKKGTKKNPEGLPQRRIFPKDEPEEFTSFCDYCLQDVRVEQEAGRRLSYFDEPINNANYSLDARINARGVPVNLVALRHAQKLIEQETEIVATKFRALTGVSFTQNEEVRTWVNRNGFSLPNMQAATIESVLEEWDKKEELGSGVCFCGESMDGHSTWGSNHSATEMPIDIPPAIEALRMRASVSYASIKKIPTMLECAGPHDNRIRGMLVHHGPTTGRWSNQIVQFQNMKRPTIKDSEDAYRDICKGISLEMLRFLYGPPLEVISSCIRHFVQDV